MGKRAGCPTGFIRKGNKCIEIPPLKGGVVLHYRIWKIDFPYMTGKYLFGGTEKDAKDFASKIKKDNEWPYQPKIKEVFK